MIVTIKQWWHFPGMSLVSDNKRLSNTTELKSLTTLLQCKKSFYNVKSRITFIKNSSSNIYMKNLS